MYDTIRQRNWTNEELRAEGFRYYERKKQLVMAARLPERLAPLPISYPLETVQADAGDVICFDPSGEAKDNWRQYDHWSVKLDIFMAVYRNWDQENWIPSPAQHHLLSLKCKPYYKVSGVWAKYFTEPIWVDAIESVEPALVSHVWIAVGAKGEPWHIEDDLFRARYIV